MLARIGFEATVQKRKQELERFRDDINRLFERSFAGGVTPASSGDSESIKESGASDGDGKSADPGDGKKRYHSIRDRLLRPDANDRGERFGVNPIGRQAAAVRGY